MGLSAEGREPGLAEELEQAFEKCRNDWIEIGRVLSAQKTGEVSHTAACGSFGSDFGVMLAWTGIVETRAAAPERLTAVCDDPWLFRQLTEIPGWRSDRLPALD